MYMAKMRYNEINKHFSIFVISTVGRFLSDMLKGMGEGFFCNCFGVHLFA